MKALLIAAILGLFSLTAQAEPQETTQPDFVVKVIIYFSSYQDLGTGSLIREDRILTCYHNIRDARRGNRIAATFSDGTERTCKVLKTSAVLDLALLEIEPVGFTPLPLATREAKKGDIVIIGGFPLAGPYAEALGKVIGYRCHEVSDPETIFLVDDKSIQGMSGGPAIRGGQQVGVLFGFNDYSNCTGIRAIRKFLKDTN